ncbi:MAG TPA: histidine kinase dimerization/phospho-acceptor domain-containing protein, partial [Actinomycetota bacterium]|nr:histidine kinase dimerization/phospho-acceptor domain-containing protein [Actinomycetota bacterium]
MSSVGASVSGEYSGRLAAKLFLAAGVLTIVNNHIPPFEHLDRPVLYGVGASAIAWGAACWFLPWQRWPLSATLALGPVALGHIAVANLFGGVSAYSYAVYFVVVFAYIGLTQPPRTSLFMSPLATAAYVVPPMLNPRQGAAAALSATVAIPVCVLVGEVIARSSWRAQEERLLAERRAHLLSSLARSSEEINSLDPLRVIETVIDTAADQGAEAVQVALYDPEAAVTRTFMARNLPQGYSGEEYPIDAGISGQVWQIRRTVVVDDYAAQPYADPAFAREGFRGVVATPIWSGGQLVAALVAGSRRASVFREEVEMFELLAAQAGRALENADRFEAERKMVEQLAELDRLKEDFLSNISHELRTPLTVIEGNGVTLRDRWDEIDPATRRDLLDRLNRNAQTLRQIITNLLDFSRLQAGRISAHPSQVNLGELTTSVAARLGSLFSDRELQVKVESARTVEADGILIERVLENLLSNASKHTPAGTNVVVAVKD